MNHEQVSVCFFKLTYLFKALMIGSSDSTIVERSLVFLLRDMVNDGSMVDFIGCPG